MCILLYFFGVFNLHILNYIVYYVDSCTHFYHSYSKLKKSSIDWFLIYRYMYMIHQMNVMTCPNSL